MCLFLVFSTTTNNLTVPVHERKGHSKVNEKAFSAFKLSLYDWDYKKSGSLYRYSLVSFKIARSSSPKDLETGDYHESAYSTFVGCILRDVCAHWNKTRENKLEVVPEVD